MGRLQTLLDRQERALARLDDVQARRALDAFDAARRELADRLAAALERTDGEVTFTVFDLARTQALVEQAAKSIQERLGLVVDESVAGARRMSGEHLVDFVEAAEPEFWTIGGNLRLDILARVSEPSGLLLHRYSVQRYGLDLVSRMQASLIQGVAQRLTYVQMRERLVGREFSALASMRPRAELIVRNEMSSAYNGAYTDEVTSLARRTRVEGDTDPLLLRISEYLDARSHPISWVLEGQTRDPDGPPFRASVAAVRAKARALRKPGGGVLWRTEGASYVGETLPAHHWERGRVHAWRKSWAADL